MHVEQFVMAYGVEQDRIRAIMPEGFESLRPVLRINAEIRDEKEAYLEFNAPVQTGGKRGWLNIAHWTSNDSDLKFHRENKATVIEAQFFSLTYTGVGIEGGCPAEKDNDGCFFLGENPEFRENETISSKKEFCDCRFAWKFHEGDANGESIGETLPAYCEEAKSQYPHCELTAENAAMIPCRKVLGAYIVSFER